MGKLNGAFDGKNTKVNDMMKGSKACQDAKGTCYVIQAKVAEVMSDVGIPMSRSLSSTRWRWVKGSTSSSSPRSLRRSVAPAHRRRSPRL